jgi:hypothetical protein
MAVGPKFARKNKTAEDFPSAVSGLGIKFVAAHLVGADQV